MAEKRAAARFALATVLLLLIRGVLLWVVIPLALLAWPICVGARVLQWRRPPTPRACTKWADAALVAVLANTVLRWGFDPVPWPGSRNFDAGLGGRPFADLQCPPFIDW